MENLENENGHGKAMEHEKIAKSHGILWFSQGILLIVAPNFTKFVYFLPPLRNQAPLFFFYIFCKTSRMQNRVRNGHGKSRNEKGMEKYFVISLWEHCTGWPHVGVNGRPNLNLTPLFNQVSQK